MTVKEYKAKNPGVAFILTGTDGHCHIPQVAMYSLIDEVYDSKIIKVAVRKSGIRNLYINYNFRG